MKKIDWEAANAICDRLTPDQDLLVWEIVTQILEKWTLWTMSVLAQSGAPMRSSRVMEQVEDISQKSLTKTLRQLEKGGLLTRVVYPEVPRGSNTRSPDSAKICSSNCTPFGSGL